MLKKLNNAGKSDQLSCKGITFAELYYEWACMEKSYVSTRSLVG